MKTNLEYIRAFFGEREEDKPLFTDEELTSIMKGHVIHQMDEMLLRKLSKLGVNYRVLDDTGLLRIRLKELKTSDPSRKEFYAGVGNWLDGAGRLYVNEFEHILDPSESVDYLHGIVSFSGQMPENPKVEAEVYLIDLKGVLIELLRIIKASRAKLALKAELAGVSVDLSKISNAIERELESLEGSYELELSVCEDYPH